MAEKRERSGLAGIVSQKELVENMEAEEQAMDDAYEKEHNEYLNTLEGYLNSNFNDAKDWKENESNIQATIIDNLNRRNGEYSPDKLAKIKESGSSDVFIGLTGVKCRAFESFVHDVYTNAKRKRTWDLKPTPIADIPREDQVRIAAQVMNQFDQAMAEGIEMTEKQAYDLASSMRASIITANYKEAHKKADKMSRVLHDQIDS